MNRRALLSRLLALLIAATLGVAMISADETTGLSDAGPLTMPIHDTGISSLAGSATAPASVSMVANGEEVLRMDEGGAFFVRGKPAESDAQIVAALRDALEEFRVAMDARP